MNTHLKITSPTKLKEFGEGKKVWEFRATDGTTELLYETFAPEIAEVLSEGVEFDAEPQVKEFGQYTHRRINKAWIDGKPLHKEDKKEYKSGGYHGKSHEDFMNEQTQMNRRTALMQSVQFWSTLEPDKELNGADVRLGILQTAESFVNWLEKGEIPADNPIASPVELESPPTPVSDTRTPKGLDLTGDEDYQKTIGKIYKDSGWTAAKFTEFINTNKEKWGGKVKWKELIKGERIIFVNLLQKEAKVAK